VTLLNASKASLQVGSEKSDSGCKVVNDDADVVQSLDRHVPSVAEAVRGGPGRLVHEFGVYAISE
ncbi:MAG TPA: hypothetical protein VJR48_14675, partial [Ktedonobacterales bacterium]|nr:hypothetical protein [Ktedonobacterales bacterium]